MSRYLLCALLLATTVALADKKPKGEPAASSERAQGHTGTPQVKTAVEEQSDEAHAKTKAAQKDAAEPQADIEQTQEGTEEPRAQSGKDGKLTSVPDAKALGMSILGNQETPTSLVIVPWKSSEVGRSMGISPMLDDSRQPVDKEVFMRALRYYEIRSEARK